MELIKVSPLWIIFIVLSTQLCFCTEYLYEYNLPDEQVSYTEFRFEGKPYILFSYTKKENGDTVYIVFDPNLKKPILDDDLLLEIFKNIETKKHIQKYGIREDIYTKFITDFKLDQAKTCKLINYNEVLYQEAVAQIAGFLNKFISEQYIDDALKIVKRSNKRNLVEIFLSINCLGEEKILKKIITNAQISKKIIENLENNEFYKNQPDLLFSTHSQILTLIFLQKFDIIKQIEDWILTTFGFKHEEHLSIKLDEWKESYGEYFNRQNKENIFENAKSDTNKSKERLNYLKSLVEQRIDKLRNTIENNYSSWKREAYFGAIIFNYNFSKVDSCIDKARKYLKSAERNLNQYKYNTALRDIQLSNKKFEEAVFYKESDDFRKLSYIKTFIWLVVLLLLYCIFRSIRKTMLAFILIITLIYLYTLIFSK